MKGVVSFLNRTEDAKRVVLLTTYAAFREAVPFTTHFTIKTGKTTSTSVAQPAPPHEQSMFGFDFKAMASTVASGTGAQKTVEQAPVPITTTAPPATITKTLSSSRSFFSGINVSFRGVFPPTVRPFFSY